MEEYSFERKKKLADKIGNIKDKTILRKIKHIILSENTNAKSTKTGGGIFMYFQDYTDDTYHKIDKYLQKVEREKLERQTRSITEISEQLLQSSEIIDDPIDYNVTRSRLRYSNKEARILRRNQYEEIIHQKPDKEDKYHSDSIDDTTPGPKNGPKNGPKKPIPSKSVTSKVVASPSKPNATPAKKTKSGKDTIFSKGN